MFIRVTQAQTLNSDGALLSYCRGNVEGHVVRLIIRGRKEPTNRRQLVCLFVFHSVFLYYSPCVLGPMQ